MSGVRHKSCSVRWLMKRRMISEYQYYWRKLRYTNIHTLEKVSELFALELNCFASGLIVEYAFVG